ncbi:MAG TPA: LysR family transcriptional regulator [Firmicutes bacterium]|nr:LysR family transcriptional regulator [Bacillota bacterium]
MDLKLLRTFQVAARHLNFHKAAEILFLSQPTVSKHIRQLEDELGCELFERWGRAITLTPAGERFLKCAARLLATSDEIMQEFASWQAGYASRLTIAASPMVARSVLPWVLQTFHERLPQVEVVISVIVSEEIPQALTSGEAEVGLSRIEPHDPRLTAELLYKDPVVFVAAGKMSDKNPLVKATTPKSGTRKVNTWLSALATYPLITHNHPGYWDDLLVAVRKLEPRVRTMVVTQVDITKRLIEEELGVSFLPLSSVQTEIQQGILQELEVEEIELPITSSWLLLRTDHPLSAGAKAFVNLAGEIKTTLSDMYFNPALKQKGPPKKHS